MTCLFCKIVKKEIETTFIFENEKVVVFRDIDPQAPTHLLIIPRKHIATINDLTPADTLIAGELIQVAKKIAKELGLSKEGYRLVFNCNEVGGQKIFHIHLHLLGGRQMDWPPG